ncbi:MAG: type I DNA topoisomerase [Dehalococcoidales bacterium]|nr:type I DNA topoisomerase [Dehalococcoidales bacterium]
MKKNLVIVESPAKARTLGRFLGEKYNLKASMGHIRDLPKSKLGIDVENNFEPKYSIPREKSKLIKELKEAAKNASVIYLATDPDREGEAISWHIAEVIQPDKIPFKRVVFHEITKEAVAQAFEHPRGLDMKLVDAQQARRILDRIVGYMISPVLWKKVRRGLSAGRVQSVAVKIIVDREREIEKFVPVEYWVIEVELAKPPKSKDSIFRATLVGLANGKKLEIHTQADSDSMVADLKTAKYSVLKVATKKVARQPAPPFITSTLQQEAWRKLRFSAKQTMSIAQQLYEGLPVGDEGNVGLITYMRTDSTNISRQAVTETRDYIEEKYGKEYLPEHARSFTRSAKFAQEAHEAIRPTSTKREPMQIKKYLNTTQFRLYQLIWQRMVASQMAAAVFENTTVDVKGAAKQSYLLRATSSNIDFPGFITLYTEGRDEDEEEDRKNQNIGKLAKGETVDFLDIFPEQRFTQPPPRFTEATLVKMLEQNGIGRPSTYAPIISTIQDRDYVNKTGGTFQPTDLGALVNDLLIENFPEVVDIKFTAQMENDLDEVANEDRNWVSVVQEFYTPFAKTLEKAEKIERVKMPEVATGEMCPNCGKPIVMKEGRFGKFLACTGYPECKYTKSIKKEVGVKCPDCGSELIERKSKKGRTFYGCSNYPKCKFATSFKPLAQKCPECGYLLVQRGKSTSCLKCKYRGKATEETPAPKT